MVQSCAKARPELTDELAIAWREWRRRNGRVGEAVTAITNLAGTPTGDAIVYLYHSLEQSLERQTKLFAGHER
jgi:hypothetical protein